MSVRRRTFVRIRSRTLFIVGFVLWMRSALSADDAVRFIDPRDSEGSSAAVVVPDVPLGHTPQILPLDPAGNMTGVGDAGAQTAFVMSALEGAARLMDPGGKPVAVKLHVVARDAQVAAEVRKSLAKRFAGHDKPAVTYVVGKLRHADALVAMDGVFALAGDAPRGIVASDSKPGAGSVLSPGPKVYISGQAEKGKDLAEMTRRTMESLAATLKYIGLDLEDVIQIKSFVGPFEEVAEAEREIIRFFKEPTQVPPLVWVEWTTAPSIEIELIASATSARKQHEGHVEFITPPGMTESPVFSRVARVAAGPSIYVSGLYGSDGDSAASEVRDIFSQLDGILSKTGSDFRHLVKATYYVSTSEASTKLNELRPEFYDPKRPPAASKAPIRGTGREGRTITVDMIAVPKAN